MILRTLLQTNSPEADPDDKPADVTIAASADYPFTNDRHFEILKQLKFAQVAVVSLQDFLSLFR